jgi:hypothetical protein
MFREEMEDLSQVSASAGPCGFGEEYRRLKSTEKLRVLSFGIWI